MFKKSVAALVALAVGGTLFAACGSTSSSTTNEHHSGSHAAKTADGCGTKATEDCTPHVGSRGSVTVDTLKWHVVSTTKAKTIGDTSLGLGSKANGEYLVVKLKVTNGKDKSVDLTDDVVKLESTGKTYDPDLDGTTAALGSGQDPLFLSTLGPDVTMTSSVVFDVPPSVAHGKPEARFGELGFGDTKGYISLPRG